MLSKQFGVAPAIVTLSLWIRSAVMAPTCCPWCGWLKRTVSF